MSELLPCPFCGGEAKDATDGSCDCCGKRVNGCIRCIRCGGEVSHFDSSEEAITAWNHRTTPAPSISEAELVDEAAIILVNRKRARCDIKAVTMYEMMELDPSGWDEYRGDAKAALGVLTGVKVE